MARKKKKQSNSQDLTEASAGFVPASVQSGSILPQKGSDNPVGSHAAPGSFEQYSRNAADYSNRRKKGRSRGVIVAIVILVIALIAGVSALGFYIYKESEKAAINEDIHNVSAEVMEAIDNELTGMTTFDAPFTMLLLGSDERSGDPDLGARTDTIVLCRIDPTRNIISMVSIPRDTKIEIDGVGTQKFNAAYTYGGPSGTIAAVKELCGVEIDHFAEVNFEGLVGLIDAIGGIDVYVEELIDDPDAGDVVIPAGEQHLDGEAALVFSRSRQYADGDFTRVSNQRKVIEAIVHKGLEAPASELYGLIQASTAFLTTDSAMDVDFIFSLADQIRHNNDYPVTMYTATIPATTKTIDEVSYVIADEAGVADMMDVFVEGGDVSGGAGDDAATDEGVGSGTVIGEDGEISTPGVTGASGSSRSTGSASSADAANSGGTTGSTAATGSTAPSSTRGY